jgi:DNA-binding MarR family transcriptional regulator
MLYSLLSEILLILDDGDRRLFGQFGLTVSRFYALVHLGDRPGLSLSELSGMMLCDKSNSTRIIKGLEADGLVIRQRHETDGRTLRLYLSKAGKTLRQRAITAHLQYNNARFGDLTPVEQEDLRKNLHHLRRDLRNHQEIEAPV